jgi:hypothetical protein
MDVLPNFGQFTTSDDFTHDFTMDMSVETPSQKRKNRSSNNPLDIPSPRAKAPKRPKPALDVEAKLKKAFDLFDELDWTVTAFRPSRRHRSARS